MNVAADTSKFVQSTENNKMKINKDQLLEFIVKEEIQYTDPEKIETFYLETVNKHKKTFNTLNDEITFKTAKLKDLTELVNKVQFD